MNFNTQSNKFNYTRISKFYIFVQVLNLTHYISFIFISLAIIFSPELDILSNVEASKVESNCCMVSCSEQDSDKENNQPCKNCQDNCKGNCNDLGCHFSSTSFISIDFPSLNIEYFSLAFFSRTKSLYKKSIHISEFMRAIWHPPKF